MKKSFLVLFLLFQLDLWSQNVSRDIELGKQGLIQVEEQMGIYKFEALDTVLQRIGQNLVSHLEKPLFTYEFYLVNSPEPNAFALPGGKIFVTRGLLILPLTEDELACVIGHEIIHSNNRHSIKQQNNSVWGALVAVPGLIIGGLFQGPIGQAVAMPFLAGNALITSSYSRGHEKEADKLGIELAAKAGYNPHQLAAILERLKAEAELLTGEEEQKSYFASHPYTPKRVAAIERNSEKCILPEVHAERKKVNFLPLFDDLLVSENPANGFISDSVFYHPAKLLRINVPNGWDNEITPRSFGMASKERDALITMSVLPDTITFGKYLKSVEKNMQAGSNLSPRKKDKIDWNGYNGGVLEYVSASSGEEVTLQIFAIGYKNGEVIRLVAMFKSDAEKKVGALLENAKAIGKKDLPKMEVEVMKLVKALNDETLDDLIRRFDATEFASLIAIINDKEATEILRENEYIKIVTKERLRF